MKQLFFLRHAKSDWNSPGLSDHDRPLNSRGRKACKKMATVFQKLEIVPDTVLCSSAERTRETAWRVMAAGDFNWNISYESGLYGANADRILSHIRSLPDSINSALIIGHNPGMEDIVMALAHNEKQKGLLERVSRKYPTGALACLAFDSDNFRSISLKSGLLQCFVKPKDTTIV